MKRLFCIAIVLLMVVGLIACGENQNNNTNNGGFKIGFGRVDVTPDLSVNLASYGDSATRLSQGWLHSLDVNTIVMTDAEGETMIMVTTDLSQGNHSLMDTIRPMITEQFGVPEDHIVIGGTHNHNAPDYGFDSPGIKQWMEEFHQGILDSIQMAMDDLAPAVAEIGRTKTERMTFVRRYYCEDNSMTGDNYYYNNPSPIVRHETDADEEIQIVRFIREGDHKDIVMVNWQAHAAKHGHTNMGSADYPGELRDSLEKLMDVHCIYYQGACGNLNPSSRIPGEQVVTTSGYDGAKEVGKRLANYVVEAINTDGVMKRINLGDIKVKRDQFAHSTSWDESNTIAVGDLSFVTLPAEFYDNLGVDIKKNEFFEMTVLMGFHCGNGQYLPSMLGYTNGGYGANNSRYRSGAGEAFVEHYLGNLKELSGK